jgi:NADH:ubiquinone oxidoreductase subunit 6 (subunit J)
MNRKILGFLFVCMSLFSRAQDATNSGGPEMADRFRQEGKIYVVITVIAIIFLAIVCLLLYIERKLKKIENKVNSIESK